MMALPRLRLLQCACLFACLCALPGRADDPPLLSFGAGWFDVSDDQQSADFRLTYRSDVKYFGHLKPWAGIEFNSDGAIYPAAGLLMDINFGRSFVLTPSLGAGLYSDGGSKDLGHTVNFRSQLEVGYRFRNRSRVSLAISHLSNASLGNRNPGTEVLSVYFHFPLGGDR